MLEVSNVRLHDGEAVEPFAHEFAAGKINVVLGRNRAGKTDLCRLIAGLNTQARGGVTIDGQDVSNLPTRRRPVGMVFQEFANYPHWDVQRNVRSALRGRQRDTSDAVVADLLHRVGLAGFEDRLPQALSGGQQQRLAIARALAGQPQVLLLDEPLVNLDYKLREAMAAELRELFAQSDVTVVYTTTDPRDAFALGDELLLLAEHRKAQSGAPLAVYQHPVSFAAADLLSEPGVNQVPGEAGLVCRPEHVLLTERASASCYELEVQEVETTGNETFVHGDVAGHDWVVRAVGVLTLLPGQRVPVYVADADHIRIGGVA